MATATAKTPTAIMPIETMATLTNATATAAAATSATTATALTTVTKANRRVITDYKFAGWRINESPTVISCQFIRLAQQIPFCGRKLELSESFRMIYGLAINQTS